MRGSARPGENPGGAFAGDLGLGGAMDPGDAEKLAQEVDAGRTPDPWADLVAAAEDPAHQNLRSLTEVARALHGEQDLRSLLDLVLDRVVDLAGAERGFLVLRRADRRYEVAASRSLDHEPILRAAGKISRSIVVQTERNGRPILTTNASMDPRFAGSDSVAHMRLRAVLCIPLAARGRSLGVLYLDHRFEEGVFQSLDLGLMEAFGAQAAIAIENARYQDDARARAEELEREIAERRLAERRLGTQNAVTGLLGAATDPAEVVPAVIRTIAEGIGWDLGGAWEADDGAGVLRCRDVWHGEGEGLAAFAAALRARTFARGEGMPGRAWAAGGPEWCPDIGADPRHPADGAAAAGLRAAVAFPVTVGGQVRGVMAFLSREAVPESPDLLAMMGSIGAQIGQFVERKRAERARAGLEDALRQAQKMEAIGRLAGGVAHDFNNILTVIMGFAQLARLECPQGSPAHHQLGEVDAAARRAATLTRQLLAFSRQQVLAVRVLDANVVILGIEAMLRRLLGEDIELAVACDADPATVRADPGQVEQVLLNLAVNARDAMPGGGRLLIQTEAADLDDAYLRGRAPECRPGPYVAVTVTDSGEGIPPEVLPHIFEPFFTTKAEGKGTGLGLATVYGIVKQSGGHLAVYSEPGHGTTFKVYLPLVGERPAAAADRPAAARPPGGTETLLLAEDDAQLRELTRRLLASQGYRVLVAADGAAALEIAADPRTRIDLLVSDVIMPRMNGIELAGRLREARPGLRVLFTSGYTGKALEGRGVLEGPGEFLEKPFTEDALARKVRQVLDGPR